MENKTTADKPNKQKNESERIWGVISNMSMDIFALPNQKVHDYFTPVTIEPTKLYLQYKVSAALPALEECLSKKYLEGALPQKFVVSTTNKYVVVSAEDK